MSTYVMELKKCDDSNIGIVQQRMPSYTQLEYSIHKTNRGAYILIAQSEKSRDEVVNLVQKHLDSIGVMVVPATPVNKIEIK